MTDTVDDIVIREAGLDDAEDLVSVYWNAYAETRELGFPMKAESVTDDEIREWIQEYRVFVSCVGDDIVGGVRIEVTDPERIKLSRLAVDETWKGRRVGTRLMDHTEAVASHEGYSTIWLTTPESHPYLADWYRERGYEKTGPYPLEYRDYDEIVLEKQIL